MPPDAPDGGNRARPAPCRFDDPFITPSDRLYLAEASAIPPLSAKEVVELGREIPSDDTGLVRDRIVGGHMHIVLAAALKLARSGVPLADLIEMGARALRHAVERFDPRRGERFGVLASWKVRRAMRRLVGRVKRIPG